MRQRADGTPGIANPTDVDRLRVAYRAAAVITARDSQEVAQAWFQGLNPMLDDRSPARMLRDGDMDEAGPQVLTAARQFAAVGPGDTLIGTPFGDMRTVARRVVSVQCVGYRPASWDWTPWEYAGADGRFHGRWGVQV